MQAWVGGSGSEVTYCIRVRSEPEASATAHARGLAGRSGSPLLETRPGIGNGDAAVADASGSDVRDRPQDWLSGILIRVASGVGDSDRGTGFQPVSPGLLRARVS